MAKTTQPKIEEPKIEEIKVAAELTTPDPIKVEEVQTLPLVEKEVVEFTPEQVAEIEKKALMALFEDKIAAAREANDELLATRYENYLEQITKK